MARLSRRDVISEAPSLDEWPTLNADALPECDSMLYLARVQAVTMFFRGDGRVREITEVTGITNLSYFVKRCLQIAPDGVIWGFRALAPNRRIKSYERNRSVGCKLPQDKGGLAGALGNIFKRFPDVEKKLTDLILKKKGSGAVYEKRIRVIDVHARFISELERNGVEKSEWPFNSTYRGLRSINRFFHTVLDESLDGSVAARESETANCHLPVGTGIEPLISFEEIYAAVEVDAHHIDAHTTLQLISSSGDEIELLLERLWLLIAIERRSTLILGHLLVYSSEVSSDDVLRLLRRVLDPSVERLPLTIPGLEYPPNSGLPKEIDPRFAGVRWGVLMLDGALAHLAESIRERARKATGFSVNWGPVGHFERRANVERTFRTVHDCLFGRYPSSTGSNPQSGRVPKGEEVARTLRLRSDHAEQLISYHVARHNILETEGLNYLSPIQFAIMRIEKEDGHMLLRKGLLDSSDKVNPIPLYLIVTVRGSIKNGRRPYIQLDRGRYTNDVLSHASGLIGKRIRIEVNEEDMRQVRAFLESDGGCIGYLRALPPWNRVKHDRRTRQAINRLISKRLITLTSTADPVDVYMSYLSSLATERRGAAKHKRSNRQAVSEMQRVSKSTGVGLVSEKSNINSMDIPEGNKLKNIYSVKTHFEPQDPIDIQSILNKAKS
ncbi:hypothetical protein [Zoogloea sp. LCSB751]|uniref:hypothetical protein n=1 Tax=Zoogloea sp. LCSB751 TaxID=1965277 RepID=UPI0011163545|nr:hypothetical protein [Zoogloea sp. LCSB751]